MSEEIWKISETSKHRDVVAQFCEGCGIDIGFGGDPIVPAAIRMDLSTSYTKTGELPVQLGGDCRDLFWFRDEVLDYVYSSHVLEDFVRDETEPILREWARIVKPGGRVILLLPDQSTYLNYCVRTGQINPNTGIVGNPHHSIPDFSIEYVMEVATRITSISLLHRFDNLGEYSFALVFEKGKSTEQKNADLEKSQLQDAWRELDGIRVKVREVEGALLKERVKPVYRIMGSRIKRYFLR